MLSFAFSSHTAVVQRSSKSPFQTSFIFHWLFFSLTVKCKMDLLNALKTSIQPHKKINIDNKIFYVCTKATFSVLTVFSILVTSRQYIGEPIVCIVEVVPQKIMNAYRWAHKLSNSLAGEKLRDIYIKDLVPAGEAGDIGVGDTTEYHGFYQWLSIALLFQAIISYTPRYI